MTDDHLSGSEAEELGVRLEEMCQEFSSRQRAFLKTALGIAAADLWARADEPRSEFTIQELVVDIQQAGAARAISLNPLPSPSMPKGPIA